jgi:hypothetical protein
VNSSLAVSWPESQRLACEILVGYQHELLAVSLSGSVMLAVATAQFSPAAPLDIEQCSHRAPPYWLTTQERLYWGRELRLHHPSHGTQSMLQGITSRLSVQYSIYSAFNPSIFTVRSEQELGEL